MRKIVLILLILLLAISLIGCGSKNEKKQQASDTYATQNQETGLNELDFDTAYRVCKEMLKRYYEAAICGETLDASQLIRNEKLQQYVELKLEYGRITPPENSVAVSYGLEDIKWNLDKGYVRLNLIAEVKQGKEGGFSEAHQFLVGSHQGSLVIFDWKSEGLGTPACLDDAVRGNDKNLDEPQLWENNEFTDHVLKKAKVLLSK